MKKSIKSLELLYVKGKMSPALKKATHDLLVALKKFDYDKISKLSWLHQKITGVILPNEPYGEDDDFNEKISGTNVYREFDYIWHSSTGELYEYVRG